MKFSPYDYHIACGRGIDATVQLLRSNCNLCRGRVDLPKKIIRKLRTGKGPGYLADWISTLGVDGRSTKRSIAVKLKARCDLCSTELAVVKAERLVAQFQTIPCNMHKFCDADENGFAICHIPINMAIVNSGHVNARLSRWGLQGVFGLAKQHWRTRTFRARVSFSQTGLSVTSDDPRVASWYSPTHPVYFAIDFVPANPHPTFVAARSVVDSIVSDSRIWRRVQDKWIKVRSCE